MAQSAKNKKNANQDGEKRKGLQLQPHQVILRPLVTEKNMFLSETHNQYTFEVNPHATKTDIKSAVELLFEVKVEKVATQTRKGKPRRYRFRYGRTKNWKKAIVKPEGDHRIDVF